MLSWLMKLKDAHFLICFKDKDTDEQEPRARSGRVQRTGASVPMESGYATLLAHGCVQQARSSLNLKFRDSMESLSHRHDPLLTQSLAPPRSPEHERGRLELHASNHDLVFLVW